MSKEFHFGHLTLISLLVKSSHFYKCLQVKVSYLLDIYRSINGDWELQALKARFPNVNFSFILGSAESEPVFRDIV